MLDAFSPLFGLNSMSERPLNDKQRRFVEEYLIDLNATQAAMRAGYSKKTAYAQGQRLLKVAEVQAAVSNAKGRRSKATGISAERVLRELSLVGLSDVRNAFHADGRMKRPEEWGDDFAASVAGVDVVTRNVGDGEVEYVHKLKLWDKNSALDKLARHLAMYNDTLQVNVVDDLAGRLSRMKARTRMLRDADEVQSPAEPRHVPITSPMPQEAPPAHSMPEHVDAGPEAETTAPEPPTHDPILPRKAPVSRVLDWPDHGGSEHQSEYDPYSRKD